MSAVDDFFATLAEAGLQPAPPAEGGATAAAASAPPSVLPVRPNYRQLSGKTMKRGGRFAL